MLHFCFSVAGSPLLSLPSVALLPPPPPLAFGSSQHIIACDLISEGTTLLVYFYLRVLCYLVSQHSSLVSCLGLLLSLSLPLCLPLKSGPPLTPAIHLILIHLLYPFYPPACPPPQILLLPPLSSSLSPTTTNGLPR